MYYLLLKANFSTDFVKRNIITVAGKNLYADLEDFSSIAIPNKVVLDEEDFNAFLKEAQGYSTKEEAKNDKEMKKALKDINGDWFTQSFSVIDETELKELYKTIQSKA